MSSDSLTPAPTARLESDREPPLNRFHLRITALTFGANFSDGYAMGSIGIALVAIAPQMDLGPVWQGVLGASVLIGIFLGAIVTGRLADVFGRRMIYMLDFIMVAVASALQFFVDGPLLLLVLRLIIGFGVGADYAIGPTLVTEFVPRRMRGGMLALLTVMWTVGYVTSFIIGSLVVSEASESWRWLLASGAIPAALVLLLRFGVPESPHWLLSQGRLTEAQAVIDRYLGGVLDTAEHATEKRSSGRLGDIWSRQLRRNTVFGLIFFNAQVIPYFAIYTFLPMLLPKMGLDENSTSGGIFADVVLLVGGVVGLFFIMRYSRRRVTIVSFFLLAGLLAVVAFGSGLPMPVVLAAFLLFTAIMSAASNLEQVYPAELYPTHLRATGVGFQNSASRVGSAIGTFLLPVSLVTIGLSGSMAIMVLILLIGGVASLFMAPETSCLAADEMGS